MPREKVNMIFQELVFNSFEQKESIKLRYEILRKPLGLEFNDEELQLESNQYHLAATQKNDILGILLLVPISDSEVKMRQVCVDAEFQKRGIGQKLVAFSEKFAKEKGYSIMTLHARKEAFNFYLGLQYEFQGDSFIEVGIPHKKMVKKLPN